MDITLEQAQKLIETAIATAKSRGFRMSFAVVDSKRDLVASARMDGSRPFTPDVARGKAMLTVLFEQPSSELVERGGRQVFQMVNELYANKLAFAPGAVPFLQDGEVIGAIAASGATGEQDEEVEIAAVAGFKS